MPSEFAANKSPRIRVQDVASENGVFETLEEGRIDDAILKHGPIEDNAVPFARSNFQNATTTRECNANLRLGNAEEAFCACRASHFDCANIEREHRSCFSISVIFIESERDKLTNWLGNYQ